MATIGGTSRDSDPQAISAIRGIFYELLEENKPKKTYVMERSTYLHYLQVLMNENAGTKSVCFSNRKRFKVLSDGDVHYLARANSNRRVYHKEELFDVILAAHQRCNHGDGRSTYAELKNFADNIFLWECTLFTKLCFCKRMKTQASRLKSWRSPQTGVGELRLFDMEESNDKLFSQLMVYRDKATCFTIVRPLKSDSASDIAFELLYIFLTFGAPLYLRSGLQRGQREMLFKALYEMWPECPSMVGENLDNEKNSEFLRLLDQWLRSQGRGTWPIGAAFVCSSLNSQHSPTLGGSPYGLLYRADGCKTPTKASVDAESLSAHHQPESERSSESSMDQDSNAPDLDLAIADQMDEMDVFL